jgi:hypothetical protein
MTKLIRVSDLEKWLATMGKWVTDELPQIDPEAIAERITIKEEKEFDPVSEQFVEVPLTTSEVRYNAGIWALAEALGGAK